MQKTIYQRLNAVLWALIVTLVVLLAIYVSVGRMLVSNMDAYQADILQELNARVPFTVEATRVSGEWLSFTPIIVLSGLTLSVPESDLPPLTLSRGRVAVDVLESLRSRSLQMSRVELEELALRGDLDEDGQFRLQGIEGSGGEIAKWLREFILNAELISLRRNTLNLGLPGGERRQLDLTLRLERDRSERRLEIGLASSRGANITILGEGVGDPFEPDLFSGELYARVNTHDLGAVRQVLANRLTGTWAEGSVDIEFWLSSDRGESELQGRINASDLKVFNEERGWQVPVQRLALDAELLQGRDRWTLFGTALEVEQGEVRVNIPRLQLDGWGQALRLRAEDVSLASLAELVVDVSPDPGRMEEVLDALDPAGRLSSVQLSFGNVRQPARDWELEARFRDLRVSSRRGAPGISSATGYFEVFPGRGRLLLDSPDLVLEFPTIYAEPLAYREFRGAIDIAWTEELVRLTSDLLVAEGEEGTAKALFGLDIPLVPNDVGLDMSLLVGVENSHPVHRVKYVPDTLNKNLEDWLSDSIGDGVVEQGAFLWRGALKKGLSDFRTVQLAFNISDTYVDYHPGWPAVNVDSGIILVDDTKVSVWADEASLYDSTIKRLSVETWITGDRALMLAVDGRMRGEAADGLSILNASPIDGLVKGAFRQWTLRGDLEIDLDFQLNLSDKTAPRRIDVDTYWRDVDVGIQPGGITLEKVNGNFRYQASRGFTSRELQGTFWGRPFTAEVMHPGLGPDMEYDPAAIMTEVRASTSVDLADVRRWIKFDSLAFAEGESAAKVRLQVVPGKPPLLMVDSELQGVALDLPDPWRKAAEEKTPLQLSAPLGEQGGPMEIELGDDLSLNLDLREGALRGGAIGVGDPPASIEPGSLRVTGYTPLLQADDWLQFIDTYFVAQPPSAPVDEQTDPNDPVAGEVYGGLAIEVDDLQADVLEIRGQSVSDVVLGLNFDASELSLVVASDWLAFEYGRKSGSEASALTVQRLDLEGLGQLDLDAGGGEREPIEVPAINVVVDKLYDGNRDLGNLAFKLESEGSTLSATAVTGQIAGMQLGQPEPGALTWKQLESPETSLRLGVAFKDLGDTLALLGYERIVETRSGNFNFDLRWPGAPQAFSIGQSEGAMVVAIREGRFLEAPSGASGALKVVNILNLADIVQRLSLSHMFESGIPFDSVDGEIFLHSGTIEVAGMDVKGPSSFYFSGVSSIEERSLNGELVATLPVADNLPWVAALTAGLPVAAGVFVVSKILQKQVNQLSSAVYSIGGSWNDPQVEFDHIFDSGESRQGGARSQPAANSVESDDESTQPVVEDTPGQSAP